MFIIVFKDEVSGFIDSHHFYSACNNRIKDKNGKTALNAFMKIVNESNRKPNKLWVNQGREFYNKLMQEWLDNNDILMYSTHNEGTSVIAERFIKTLKAKIYKK